MFAIRARKRMPWKFGICASSFTRANTRVKKERKKERKKEERETIFLPNFSTNIHTCFSLFFFYFFSFLSPPSHFLSVRPTQIQEKKIHEPKKIRTDNSINKQQQQQTKERKKERKKAMIANRKVFFAVFFFFFFAFVAKAADFDVYDDVDIDSVDAMRQAFLDETIKESKVTLFDTKTGKKLESAAAWASYDPRNASRMHVGYFIPDAEQETAAGQPDTLELCGFTKSENCKNEQPYPRDEANTETFEDPFECGIDDETRPDTGFVCTKVGFTTEEDGDLAYEGDIAVPEEEDEAEEASNNRRLLQLRRRAGGLRSRSLRSNGARGRIG